MIAANSHLPAVRRAYFSDHSVLFYSAVFGGALFFAAQGLALLEFILLVAAGWLIYLPEEYLSHVFAFHGFMPKNKTLYRLLYRLHHGHHDKPRRLDLLFTPMWYTFPALLLNVLTFAMITQNGFRSAALCAGLVLGYLMFEWWHLIVHSPHEPGPILRYVRHQHMGHHHWNERRWYIISPPGLVFDFIFGTAGEVHKAPKSISPTTAGLDQSDERLIEARKYYRDSSDWKEDASAIWKSHHGDFAK